MTLSRQVLRKIDDALRAEFDEEKGEWMAKVPVSGATKVVWQDTARRSVSAWVEGVALLMLNELASIAGEDAETLANRLETRKAEMKARVQEFEDREKELKQRDRVLSRREAGRCRMASSMAGPRWRPESQELPAEG